MTLLPIVERELRTAARRTGTYWNRLIVAVVAVLLGASIFIVDLGASPQQIGQFIFRGLAGLLLFYCLVQGRRSSADCLSEEKREGTLGLLFLTDLKGHDVVLGKLVATSLGGFYGLMTVFPVLAMTLLLGGISSGEFWRMVLVLVNTFLFSLAVGVMSSSLSRDYRRAMAANFFLLLCLAAIPPACASMIAAYTAFSRFPPPLLYPCPIYTFIMAFDTNYLSRRWDFWWSLGVIHGLTWLLVGLASWVVPHAWQDRPSKAGRHLWREFWRFLSCGRKSKQAEYRRQLLNVNAFYWLASRARLKTVHVWGFLGCMVLWWAGGWITEGAMWLDETVPVMTALLMNTTLKMWVVIEAGQRLAEDQKAGALELLLSTPLSVKDILHGQWLALRRQFLRPLVAVLALELVLMFLMARRPTNGETPTIWLAGMFMLVADILALGWVAMRAALTAKNPNRATATAMFRILVVPLVVAGFVWAMVNAWYVLTSDKSWDPSWQVCLGLWFWPGLAADLIFGLIAWRQLRLRFRHYALQRYAPTPRRFSKWRRQARPVPGVPPPLVTLPHPAQRHRPRKWKWAVAALLVVILGAGLARSRRRSQFAALPVMTVTLASSNHPVVVSFWGEMVVLVLPDGTLWRWGTWSGAPTRAPERVGTNGGWVKVSLSASRWISLQRDGTLWDDGFRGENGDSMKPVAAGYQWIDVAGSVGESYGIRRDGTLWGWTKPSGTRRYGRKAGSTRGRSAGQASAVAQALHQEDTDDPSGEQSAQIGTNRNWAAIRSCGRYTVGLQTDGTLWAWDQLRPMWNSTGYPWALNASSPIRVCADTNWVALCGVFGGLAVWNRSGELWDPFFAAPKADAPINSIGRLIVSNSAPRRLAMAFGGQPALFEIRTNGTLWTKTYPMAQWIAQAGGAWRQVGKRTDWVSVWGEGNTAIGLTSDGTLWTWGLDVTHTAPTDLFTRLQIARNRISTLFGSRTPMMMGGFGGIPVYVGNPRPFMKLERNSPAGDSDPAKASARR
jgi:ABC-type Na+ efflux pump permease subunit